MISRDSLREVKDLKIEKVNIPEWGDFVYVRSLSGLERDQFESSMYVGRKENLSNLRARLVVLALSDENGNRILNDDDISWVGTKNSSALNTIFVKAQELSGMRERDIKEMEKNLEPPLSECSTGESPKS